MGKRLRVNEPQHAQTMLDTLPDGSVILDRHGHAWQAGNIYWYRAYGDDSMVSSWDLAQTGHPFTVIHEAPKRQGLPVGGGW